MNFQFEVEVLTRRITKSETVLKFTTECEAYKKAMLKKWEDAMTNWRRIRHK